MNLYMMVWLVRRANIGEDDSMLNGGKRMEAGLVVLGLQDMSMLEYMREQARSGNCCFAIPKACGCTHYYSFLTVHTHR